jgi:hypothetical protein
MPEWNSDEVARIGAADELRISSVRPDGTLTAPVTIWVVPHGDELYVRSANGSTGGWYRRARVRHRGRIRAGRIGKDVTFTDVADGAIAADLDAAYRISAATLKLTPR